MRRLPINESKVKALIRQCKHLNVFPIFLDRYLSKTESNPISDALAELIEECVQYLKIMSPDEIDGLVDGLPPFFKLRIDYKASSRSSDALFERIALNYMMAVVQESYLSFKKIVTADMAESEVAKIYPEVLGKLDDDGLLLIDESIKLFDGGIEYKDHILHYHQFLRRGYSSNPNFDFLGRFIRYYLQTRPKNRFRIAIDHHRIMPKEFYRQIAEMDAWFGPKFDKNKLDDINAVGLTVIARSKPSLFDLSGNVERTEFYWSYKDGIKTFEVEEISGKDYFFDPYYLNRYVHAERDTKLKVLRHCDGAVKVYPQNSYEKRLSSQMPTELKSIEKIKLFRIDGDIDVDEWMELLSLFYKGNEMIIEYFNPEQFEQLFGERIRHYQSVMRERNSSI